MAADIYYLLWYHNYTGQMKISNLKNNCHELQIWMILLKTFYASENDSYQLLQRLYLHTILKTRIEQMPIL